MCFDENFLREVLSDVTLVQDKFPKDASFCIDTRRLLPGDIFVALQGANVDGHDFIKQALLAGASGLFIAQEKRKVLDAVPANLLSDKLVVLVPDVLDALTKLAAAWRARFEFPVVAITGSVGKTSTKQLVGNVLSLNKNNFFVSEGNQNTKIGLALNMLKLSDQHEGAVFEVGISRRGEMAALVDMLQPSTALITGVGHSHMEGLGALSDIALEKRDVFKNFKEDSIGIINGDQPILAGVGYCHPVIKFGSKTTNQIQARKINFKTNRVEFVLKIYKKKYNVVLENPHSGSVFNALAATAVSHLLGVADSVIVEAIQQPLVVESRFEHRQLRGDKGVMINDCYNANPESMKAALLALENIETSAQKVAVLGDMLELGVNSPFWHRQLGRFLRKVPSLREVILVGDLVEWTKKTVPLGVRAEHVASWEDAVKKLQERLGKDNVVLVKGSNGMNLKNLVDHFAPKSKEREVAG